MSADDDIARARKRVDATIILEAVVGSTLHGTNVDDGLEDLDLMAVAIESMDRFVGFRTEDTWVTRSKPDGVRSEAGDVDHVTYGLRKFLDLALKGNPTVMLVFFAPESHVRILTPLGKQLRDLAPQVASRCAFPRFQGYMRQQHERLLGLRGQRNVTRPELVSAYGYDTKYAAHIVRLGLQGEEFLRTGRISLPMPDEQRDLVRKVRSGGFSLAEVSQLLIESETRLVAAAVESPLPTDPDRGAVELWMMRAYLSLWAWAAP